MKYTFFLLFSIFFLSCANTVKESEEISKQEKTSEEIEHLSGDYKLISIKGVNVSSEDIFLKVDNKGESLVINAGCNVIRVDFLQQKEKINFQHPVSTEMYCEGKMEFEKKLNVILPEIFEIEESAEDILILKSGKDVLLTIHKNRE